MTDFKLKGTMIPSPYVTKRENYSKYPLGTKDSKNSKKINSPLFHYRAVEKTQTEIKESPQYCNRALNELVSLGVLSQDEVKTLRSNLIEALQTLHVAAAMGLKLDGNGNTILEDEVDGEKSIRISDLLLLTSNEIEEITYTCQSAEEVFKLVNNVRNNNIIGKIEARERSVQYTKYFNAN